MTKIEFILSLSRSLQGLPQSDVTERLEFYNEMIDDRIEDGLSEEEAVAAIGSVESVADQILSEIPLTRLVKEKIKPQRKMRAWEIVLLAVGSPIWLSLLIAAFAIVISLYAVLWSLVATVWAVFAAFAGCALGLVAGGIIFFCLGNIPVGLASIGAALVLAGLAILTFFASLLSTKGAVKLTKLIAIAIKRLFVRKEAV